MNDPSSTERRSAQILLFRAAARRPSAGADEAFAPRAVERDRRFVYDVKACRQGFAVTFDGTVITQHLDQAGAIANARLIAANFWASGVPTLVRVVNPDGTIAPIVAFG